MPSSTTLRALTAERRRRSAKGRRRSAVNIRVTIQSESADSATIVLSLLTALLTKRNCGTNPATAPALAAKNFRSGKISSVSKYVHKTANAPMSTESKRAR